MNSLKLKITFVLQLTMFVVFNYAQVNELIKEDLSKHSLQNLEISIDSIDINMADGTKERQVYINDLSNGRFTELYKIWDGSNWINDWHHVYNYENNKLTSRCKETWLENSWITDWCYHYKYDESWNLISDTFEYVYPDGNWYNVKRTTKLYNSLNQNTHRLDEEWKNSEWVSKWQASYEYDDSGNKIFLLSQNFNDGVWENERRTSIVYDESANVLLYQVEIWNGADQWLFDNRAINTYSENKYLVHSSIDEWKDFQWMNNNYTSYQYNGKNNVISELVGHFEDSTFIELYRNSYEYNSIDQKVSELNEWWNAGMWELGSRRFFEYDISGNLLLNITDHYANEMWTQNHRNIYKYENNQLVKVSFENNTNGLWQKVDGFQIFNESSGYIFYIIGAEITIYYNNITEVNRVPEFANVYTLKQNYPNPFNPRTTIKYSIPESEFIQLTVYDMLGREVSKLVNEEQSKGAYKIEFDSSRLTSGIYFYRLQSGKYVETKKMLLMK